MKVYKRVTDQGVTDISETTKYRDPATQKTWSGRGKRPQWIHDALAAGKSLADYAI